MVVIKADTPVRVLKNADPPVIEDMYSLVPVMVVVVRFVKNEFVPVQVVTFIFVSHELIPVRFVKYPCAPEYALA